MTTTPQEPSEQEDPQSHVHRPPDRIPDAEDTLEGGGALPEESSGPQLDQEAAEHESEQQPGVDPDWPQQAD